ncbi:MAG: pantetheine-phosphate adenylyltransferase [Chloroflexota bacterium]
MTVALYPGSFDPITNGHIDVAMRAARLFEKLIVGIYATPNKRIMFTIQERVELAKDALSNVKNIEVVPFSSLVVNFARTIGAQTMVRGLRAGSDFEREFDLALMNRKLNPELELVCLMASQEYQFLSSSILKEIARLGGKINEFVPDNVAQALKKKLATGAYIPDTVYFPE